MKALKVSRIKRMLASLLVTVFYLVKIGRCEESSCPDNAALPRVFGLPEATSDFSLFNYASINLAENIQTLIGSGAVYGSSGVLPGYLTELTSDQDAAAGRRLNAQSSDYLNFAVMHLISIEDYANEHLYLLQQVGSTVKTVNVGMQSSILEIPDNQVGTFTEVMKSRGVSYNQDTDVILMYLRCTMPDIGESPYCAMVQMHIQAIVLSASSSAVGPDRYNVNILKQYTFNVADHNSAIGTPTMSAAKYSSGLYGAMVAIAHSDGALIASIFPNEFEGAQSRTQIQSGGNTWNEFVFEGVRFDHESDNDDIVYFLGQRKQVSSSQQWSRYGGLWAVQISKVKDTDGDNYLSFDNFSALSYTINGKRSKNKVFESSSVKFMDFSWIDAKPIILLRTGSDTYIWSFASPQEEAENRRQLAESSSDGRYEMLRLAHNSNQDGDKVYADQIECMSWSKRCTLVMTFGPNLFYIVNLVVVSQSFEIEKLQRLENASLFNDMVIPAAFQQTSDAKDVYAYFALNSDNYGSYTSKETYNTIVGSSRSDVDCSEGIGLYDQTNNIGTYLTLKSDGYAYTYDDISLPLERKQTASEVWFEETTGEVKIFKHTQDYGALFQHETWFDDACQLNISKDNLKQEVEYEISNSAASTSDSSKTYFLKAQENGYHSESCPDQIKSIVMLFSDSEGRNLPVQDLIEFGVITGAIKESVSQFYSDRSLFDNDLYQKRVEIYGSEYNENALELAYRIHQSIEFESPDTRNEFSLTIDTNERRFDSITLQIRFDVYASWQVVRGGPFTITMIQAQLPTIETFPKFYNAFKEYKEVYLDVNQNPRSKFSTGGLQKSLYGPTEEVYMQVYYKSLSSKLLMFASKIPLREESIKNTDIYTSMAINETGRPMNFQDEVIEDKRFYQSGYFPAWFYISDTDVVIYSEATDSIFDSGLYEIKEVYLNDLPSSAASANLRSGGSLRRLATGAAASSITGSAAASKKDNYLTEFISVPVLQEISIHAEIELQSSISRLTTTYDLYYHLQRKIERSVAVYVEKKDTVADLKDKPSNATKDKKETTTDKDSGEDKDAASGELRPCGETKEKEKKSSDALAKDENYTDSGADSKEKIKNEEQTNADEAQCKPVDYQKATNDRDDKDETASGKNDTGSDQPPKDYDHYFDKPSSSPETDQQSSQPLNLTDSKDGPKSQQEKESETYRAVISDPIDEQVIKKIEKDVKELVKKKSGNVDKAIAEILKIENAEEATKKSQRVAKVKDDTDLDKAAKFDIFEYLQKKGIKTKRQKKDSSSDEVSKFAVVQEIKETFVLPELDDVNSSGDIAIKFSSEIQPQPFSKILYYLKKEQAITSKRKLSDEDNKKSSIEDETELDELESIEHLLKLAGCVSMELVPGTDTNLDKKTFEWKLEELNGSQLALLMTFDNPEYISMDATDSIKVSFSKSAYFIQPVEQGKQAIPDNYNIVVQMPTQTKTQLLSEEQIETAKTGTQAVMITNILLKGIFSNSLQMMFGSIISLQILAHLPLANIQIPANAQQTFDFMIEIVSFDYFPIHDYFDFGFTETEPWSIKFLELGYETVNFIEGMGSIILFIWIGAAYLAIVVLFYFVCKTFRYREKLFNARKSWESSLGFLEGTIFETMVCVSVSMRSFEYFEYLNSSDKFSIANHMIVLLIVVLFIGLILYFTVFRMPKLVALYTHKQRVKKKDHIQEARSKFKDMLKTGMARRGSTITSAARLQKMASQEANDHILNQTKREEEQAKSLSGVKKQDFQIYKPFFSSLRKNSRLSLMNNFFVMVRRLILLYMAMFMAYYSWLQVIVFTTLSVMFIAYLGFTHPFKSKKENSLNFFNEGITSLVAYQVMVLNGLCTGADQYQNVGHFIVAILYFCWGVNGLIIGLSMFFELKKRIRKCYYKYKNKNKKTEELKISEAVSRKKNYSTVSAVSARKQEVSVIEEEVQSIDEESFDVVKEIVSERRNFIRPHDKNITLNAKIRLAAESDVVEEQSIEMELNNGNNMKFNLEVDAERMISKLQVIGHKVQDQANFQPTTFTDTNYKPSETVKSVVDGQGEQKNEAAVALEISAVTESVEENETARPHFVVHDESFSQEEDLKLEAKKEKEDDSNQDLSYVNLEKDDEEDKDSISDGQEKEQVTKEEAVLPKKNSDSDPKKSNRKKRFQDIGRVETKELFATNFSFFKFKSGSMVLRDEPVAQNFYIDDPIVKDGESNSQQQK